MRRHSSALVGLAVSLFGLTAPAAAQFSIGPYAVQVHGFFSQGFAYSNENNYLTLPTSQGSFALTDGGISVSSVLTDKLRVGAQAYARRVGQMGQGRPQLDWASVDYRWRPWLGVRAGQVKSVLGLYNESQDVESLHTWALLPQSVYALDTRSARLAHLGADAYGDIDAGRMGTLEYTLAVGRLPAFPSDGYAYGLQSLGLKLAGYRGSTASADVRLRDAVPGLTVGGSFAISRPSVQGTLAGLGAINSRTVYDYRPAFLYGQYTVGNFRFDAEFEKFFGDLHLYVGPEGAGIPVARSTRHIEAWYVAGAYRFNRFLEVGTYHSRDYPGWKQAPPDEPLAQRRIRDQAVTARIDLNRHVDLKLEGHFINGYGDSLSFQGFYAQDNPQGLKPRTNLAVVRLGVSF